MRTKMTAFGVLISLLAVAGCANYRWTSGVPENMRTISVPTFRNGTDITELGSVVTIQLLRELQREGTFKIRGNGDGALEIQGEIKSASSGGIGGNDRAGSRIQANSFKVSAIVSVIDKVNGKVLVNNRPYTSETVFTSGEDLTTGRRDASGRAAEELARQIVDDLMLQDW